MLTAAQTMVDDHAGGRWAQLDGDDGRGCYTTPTTMLGGAGGDAHTADDVNNDDADGDVDYS